MTGRCKGAGFRTAYWMCLHQACINLNGDGRAITSSEQMYFAVVVVYGSLMNAALFGKMASLLLRLDEGNTTYQRKLLETQRRVAHLGLAPDLQDRILRYYEQLWETQQATTNDTHAFLHDLTPRLHLDARLAIHADMIKQIPFMRRVTRNMLEQMVMCMKARIYMESECIMRRGDRGRPGRAVIPDSKFAKKIR